MNILMWWTEVKVDVLPVTLILLLQLVYFTAAHHTPTRGQRAGGCCHDMNR